ncbi:F-box domain protein [Aspergillus sp. HF37]|nr:F-box domain protein [Aspergillus sp. HF37]
MPAKPRSLDSITYDVFYQIACQLDCHDFVSLSRVSRSTYSLMLVESIARKTIENSLLHTKEGQRANRSKSGYRRAVARLFEIKEAFATAQPFSVAVLAYASAFLYNGGSLCYVRDEEIRVLDVHAAAQTEQVLSVGNILPRVIPGCSPDEDTQLSLMHYNEGILAFLVELPDRDEAWLLAVDVRRHPERARNGRLRLRTPLQSTRRLFVRHSKSYLYYGTHSALGYHGYQHWAVDCVDLKTGRHLTDKPVELEDFAGNEIGQTVCFGVHSDHLYAVSTQVNFEEEEVDWTSFYIWICLSPWRNMKQSRRDQALRRPNRIWRRQHREGPINDSWADLSLRNDEETARLTVLECRREWRDGGSENSRTYYMQALPSPEEIFEASTRERNPGPDSSAVQLPDDPLAKMLDSSSKPNYERPKKRLRRHYHTEYQPGSEPLQRRDFILARTKFRTYNLSASTFVDLVNDPDPASDDLVPRDRLRLRTVSRKRKCPIDEAGEEGEAGLLFRPDTEDADGRPMENSEERFATRGIHMWPPDDAPRELTDLLCPSKRAGQVHAVADERSLVYSVDKDGGGDGNQAIVLVNFDPYIRLPGLRRLSMPEKPWAQDQAGAGVDIERPRVGDVEYERKTVPVKSVASSCQSQSQCQSQCQAVPSVREEAAMYRCIKQGYWLR